MRFARLSDLHLRQSPVKGISPGAGADADADAGADAIVEDLVRDVCRTREAQDFVVESGDLTDDADPASFGRFEALFTQIDLQILVVPGNRHPLRASAAATGRTA